VVSLLLLGTSLVIRMGDSDRDARAKDRALLRRDSVVARIRHVHQLATRSASDQAVRSQLVVAI